MKLTRFLTASAASAAVLVGLAGPALAHVSVHPEEATQGGFQKLTFQVPTERDVATTKVKVQLPPDHPMPFVSVKPKTGWTSTLEKTTLTTPVEAFGETYTEVVSTVTWEGGEVKPGEFDDFEISVGPLPDDVDELSFKAIQTYADGEEVLWTEPVGADGAEPEHPAPVLKLVPGASGHGHAAETTGTTAAGTTGTTAAGGHGKESTATTAKAGTTAAGDGAAVTAAQKSADDAKTMGTIGVGVGGLSLVVGIAALVTGRKPKAA